MSVSLSRIGCVGDRASNPLTGGQGRASTRRRYERDKPSVDPRSPRTRYARVRARRLLAAAALPSSAAAAPGSGTGAWVWVLAAVGAAVLVFTLLRLRAGRQGSRGSLTDIADGRKLLIARGRRVTEELTALTDAVAERDDEAATRHASARARRRRRGALAHRPRIGTARAGEGAPGSRRGRVADRRAARPPRRLRRAAAATATACPPPASSTAATGSRRSTSISAASPCSAFRCARARPAPWASCAASGRTIGIGRDRRAHRALAGRTALVRLLRLGAQGPQAPALRRRAALRSSPSARERAPPPDGRRARPRRARPRAAGRARGAARGRRPTISATTSTSSARPSRAGAGEEPHAEPADRATPSRPWRARRRRAPSPRPSPRATRSPSSAALRPAAASPAARRPGSMRAVANALLWPVRSDRRAPPGRMGGARAPARGLHPVRPRLRALARVRAGRRADGAPARARRRARRARARHLRGARGAATGRSTRPASSWTWRSSPTSSASSRSRSAFVIWVYIRRHEAYALLRNCLFATFMLAVPGYIFYPTAPPRLLAVGGLHRPARERDAQPAGHAREAVRQPLRGDAEPAHRDGDPGRHHRRARGAAPRRARDLGALPGARALLDRGHGQPLLPRRGRRRWACWRSRVTIVLDAAPPPGLVARAAPPRRPLIGGNRPLVETRTRTPRAGLRPSDR